MGKKIFRSFEELKNKVDNKKQRHIVVAAADKGSLLALKEAKQHYDVMYTLVGDKKAILQMAEGIGDINITDGNIIDKPNDEDAAACAVALIKENKGDILMKGKLATSILLKAVVNKQTGISTGGLMSHMTVLESASYHKLMFITDGGMNINPSLEQKKHIIQNSVNFMQALGYTKPNIAILAAVETVNDKMAETVEAAELASMNVSGEISGCTVEGPLSVDIALSADSARIKGFRSEIAGEVDLFLMPNISAGNIMSKSLIYLAGAKMAGCVLGAKAPIILVSRGASAEEKQLSVLLTMSALQ